IEEGEDSLNLLTQGLDYDRYPFERDLGLPREEHVEEVVKANPRGREDIIKTMVEAKEGKIGVREKVEEVLGRRAGINGEGKVVWKS
ncbi:MAG: hypothetical protein L6R42_006270, partial [Xanthoria sp. 1 TBL-2021]